MNTNSLLQPRRMINGLRVRHSTEAVNWSQVRGQQWLILPFQIIEGNMPYMAVRSKWDHKQDVSTAIRLKNGHKTKLPTNPIPLLNWYFVVNLTVTVVYNCRCLQTFLVDRALNLSVHYWHVLIHALKSRKTS